MIWSRPAARALACIATLMLWAGPVSAQVTGTVRVSVRDEQNLAVANAEVTLKSAASAWTQTEKADARGEAVFAAVPVGQYAVTAAFEGFSPAARQIAVASNVVNPVSLQLSVAGLSQDVQVAGTVQTINPES